MSCPPKASAARWFVFPNVFFSPETGFGGGVVGAVFLAPADSAQVSRVQAATTYTEREQYALELLTTLFPYEGDWSVQLGASARDYPDVFFGLGQDSASDDEEGYTLRSLGIELAVTRRLARSVRAPSPASSPVCPPRMPGTRPAGGSATTLETRGSSSVRTTRSPTTGAGSI